ncbi:hypothetical protein FF125_09485 [Aureibaculum algae]|uniref:Carboxypeptidase regulatory-like domain-containing protein n=1 Tax=Aureibaculum algae TaxID=2584122 RepID=A0A5B7TVH8_9FLAO|nr:hypothetical protein [Aureibaculum algae]QCX38652.1 hypothetical protein FF125_09485 [Aureibaculum algae]
MKNSWIAVIALVLVGCSTEYYEGYVYFKDKPVKDVFVKEKDGNMFSVQTDDKGYFKLEKTIDAKALIFMKSEFENDTVILKGLDPIATPFLRAQSDTLQLEKAGLLFDTEGAYEVIN